MVLQSNTKIGSCLIRRQAEQKGNRSRDQVVDSAKFGKQIQRAEINCACQTANIQVTSKLVKKAPRRSRQIEPAPYAAQAGSLGRKMASQ